MTFDEYIGVHGYGDRDGAATAEIEILDHHCNPTGNINGGVIISLADNLSTGAANRAYFEKTGEKRFMVGVDLHAVMLANQQGGRIRALSRPVRVGRRITVIRTEVRGTDDRLLAEVTTTHVPT
ncbi:MAG: PaaI family thioesterase [Pseudomonadales bacterium]